MDLSIATSAFALLFLAEMGDKTQLMAMALAHRYRVAPVTAGVLLAFLVLNLMAVLVGEALFRYVPQQVTLLAAAALFLFFAYRLWREGDDEDTAAEAEKPGGHGAFATSFGLIFLAELGDKTQLAMVAMVAGTGDLWSVFLGGTLALWAISLMAIAIGGTVLRRIPKLWVHRVAAGMFLAFGLLAIGQVLTGGAIIEA